jgi:hypothetical protein
VVETSNDRSSLLARSSVRHRQWPQLADNGLMQCNIPGVRRHYCAAPFVATHRTEIDPSETFGIGPRKLSNPR